MPLKPCLKTNTFIDVRGYMHGGLIGGIKYQLQELDNSCYFMVHRNQSLSKALP